MNFIYIVSERTNTTSGFQSNYPRSTNPIESFSGQLPIYRSLSCSSGGGVIETINNPFWTAASTSSGKNGTFIFVYFIFI